MNAVIIVVLRDGGLYDVIPFINMDSQDDFATEDAMDKFGEILVMLNPEISDDEIEAAFYNGLYVYDKAKSTISHYHYTVYVRKTDVLNVPA